jgi:L-cysteine desulfidase
MHQLSGIIREDMKPALGVTEPGAVAFCTAKAREYTEGNPVSIDVELNSGMYKNAFTCGIPNSEEVGAGFAAALGFAGGNARKGLEALADITEADNAAAAELWNRNIIHVKVSEVTSRLFIRVTVTTPKTVAAVTIRDGHTNITEIRVNGEVRYGNDALYEAQRTEDNGESESMHAIHRFTLQEMLDYIETVGPEEIAFVKDAYEINLELFRYGLESERTVFVKRLLARNGGKIISDDEQKTASLLCGGAIEARVLGLNRAAMSITGSGAHGIIATLPLYAACKVNGYDEERLYRATMLSYLICTYIKEYSGRLSAFCGCAIAAGAGMACGLVWLRGGRGGEMTAVLNHLAGSITGMICDGGNKGCTLKGLVAVDAAYQAADLAMHGIRLEPEHGICGRTPEETMRNMGRIADPGMTGTEREILRIMGEKET